MSVEDEFTLAVIQREVAECRNVEELRKMVVDMHKLLFRQRAMFNKILKVEWNL
jgi:hypothetical protein